MVLSPFVPLAEQFHFGATNPLLGSTMPGLSVDPDSQAKSQMKKGTKVAGRYRLVAQQGKGGMGEVWEAKDLTLSRHVAVKFLDSYAAKKDPDLLPLFRDEARHGAALGFHPCVVPVIDYGHAEIEGETHHFFIQEYVDGIGLDDWVESVHGNVDDNTVVALSMYIGHQLACAVEHAHSHQIVHRDISPPNILLSRLGEVKLTDFGLCKISDEATRSHTARAWGTLPYMAPEQVWDEKSSKKSDVYQFGATLYYALTGEAPFKGNSFRRLQENLKKPAPKFSEQIDADRDLLKALNSTLAKQPVRRPSIPQVRKLIAPQAYLQASLVGQLNRMGKRERERFFAVVKERRQARGKTIRITYPMATDLWQTCIALTVAGVNKFAVEDA